MRDPARPDGRLHALYAAAAGSLETASLAVKAVWLICVRFWPRSSSGSWPASSTPSSRGSGAMKPWRLARS
jgi:hypothetical protein